MKEASVPGFIRRRELLDGEGSSREALASQGGDFYSLGLLDEALTFFAEAGDREGMEKVLEKSRSQGDAFTFEAALRALGKSASRSDWKDVGEKALAAGQLWFSYRAFEKADHQTGLEEVRRIMAEKEIPPPL